MHTHSGLFCHTHTHTHIHTLRRHSSTQQRRRCLVNSDLLFMQLAWESKAAERVDDFLESYVGIRDNELGEKCVCVFMSCDYIVIKNAMYNTKMYTSIPGTHLHMDIHTQWLILSHTPSAQTMVDLSKDK